jgi:hypothetical protein
VRRRFWGSARQCVDVGPIFGSGQNVGRGGCGILPQLSPSLSRNGRGRDHHDAAQAYAAKLAGAQPIADAGSDLAGVSKLVKAMAALGVTALVIAPFGGVLKAGPRSVTVDRTLLTARSVQFDALVVAGGTTATADIKLVVLLQEAFRHCKVLAAWGDGDAILHAAGIAPADPGIEIADSVDAVFTAKLAAGLGLHRAWDRAATVMASAAPPAG